jgi:hypothetical protein
MSATITASRPASSISTRAGTLRAALTADASGHQLLTEFLPPDVASASTGSVLDFCDWSQFDQWPQSW